MLDDAAFETESQELILMLKKSAIFIAILCLSAVFTFTGFGIWHAKSQTPSFELGGYILQGDAEEVKQLSFKSGENYTSTLSGAVRFKDTDGNEETVSKESFVHFDDNSVMALSDGILLDFSDLSENFINNYFITAKLRISETGGSYTAETTAGSMKFGEHLWKLSDSRYMIEAPTLKVHISEEDVREANDYVQVTITDDQIVHILTPENLWMTISEDCYIETAGGIKIYPASQLIESSSYKLSLAKLSVSTEDAIVLTEDETRRQIVPELNIEAIDGADGENGENGRAGQNGEAGQSGESGTDGKNGEAGQTGASGSSGSSGSTGASGYSGSTGASGANGVSGSGGKNGGNGSAGKDAVAESSTNSALPTMAINDWQVSASGLKGTISVTDAGGFLTAVSELDSYQTRYPGKVTITNVATGAVIACYEAVYDEMSGYTIPDGDTTAFDGFYQGAEEVYFSTKADALEPDTQYSLSVTAYYKATDQTNMVYSREFISRIFYTDSTGVCLNDGGAEQESLNVQAVLSADYQDTLAAATVYLLTPSQNESFTAASISSTENYIASYALSFENLEDEAAFTGLTPNTSYVARVYVETSGGLKTLTSQELELKTLKRTPTTETGAVPTANYNRVTGAFEVYRPVVTDTDGGAVSYTYTAYRLDNGNWVNESSRSIDASAAEPVEFHLQSGETYRFGVELKFDDNEKLVYYDLGKSTDIKSEGDSMPKITLITEDNGVDWNKYNGLLRISLGQSSSMTVDNTHPLRLEFYADQVQNEAVTLVDGNPVKDADENRYTITLNENTLNTNQIDVNLVLKNLYKNTNYSVTVYGYLDVGDGNGAVSRSVGTVSFRTYDTLGLNATWSTTDNSGSSISRTLLLSVQDSHATDIRSDYALEELKEGQVTVELFSGTGVGKLRIAQKNFNESDELDSLFTSGLEITEDDFGSPQLSSSGSYTLTVSAVTDRSFGLTQLGYVNSFDSILNASEVVVAEPTPPDLLADSAQGVKATPIYNKNAATYGGSVKDTLPDDAIVGYLLEASYDNVQRIGKSITYYAFEYNTFFNALATQDPLSVDDAPLMKMTLNIDSGSDSVPNVALLFGGTKSDTGTYMNGYYTYFAGEANQPGGSLISGMDRGYRYIFAYTVEYSAGSSGDSETTKIYPYGHREYDNYNKLYGGVKENGIRIGNNVAYILNSGMCEAPALMPDFHTYVYSSEQDVLGSASATTATGSVTIHYSWRDPDKLINTDNTANNTNIFCDNSGSNEPMKQKIQQEPIADTSGWYEARIPYVFVKGSDVALAPAVDIAEYKVNYSNMLSRFNLEADADSYVICKVPLEWSWGQQLTMSGYDDIMLTMEPNYEENYIAFRFDESNPAASALISRAAAMKLTFRTTPGGKNEKTFLLPLISEAGMKFVRIATGLLGTDYLGKEFEVVNAELLYDTGVMGWNILEQAGAYFALQYKNSANAPEEFLPSNYIGASTLENVPANGALLSLGSGRSLASSQLRSVIGSDSSSDTKLAVSLYNQVTTANTYVRYLYPTRMGIDAGNGANVSQLSGQYLVPKQLASYSLSFVNGDNKGTLSEMTPTIDKPYFGISSSEIAISSIKVSGLPEEGGTIYVAAYTDRDSAEDLSSGYTDYKEIPIGSDGKPVGEDRIILTDMTGTTKYYLAFFYNKDGRNVLLLNSDSAQTAIYEVTTSDYAVINVTEIKYRNDSYFDKAIEADFSISRIFNLSLGYDIYASEEDAVNGGTPVLSNDEMDSGDENDILNAPTTVAYQNHMSINLMPSAARSKLKPGTTYWLRISASESNGTDAGSTVVPFTITAVGNYDALIYVSDAAKDSISFNVTINDPQYTLMGRNGGSENGAALYAVRFVDGEGRVLKTSYDDKVYSAAELRKEFILNDETLLNDEYGYELNKQMQENSSYSLRVYAVPDNDHDGIISLGGDNLSWDSFFDKSASDLKDSGKKFLAVIDSFWNTDTSSANSSLEKQLLIAEKQQNTLPESGWILNEDGIFTIRYNPTTLRIQFDESVGLIGEEPVFKQIDWYVNGRTAAGVPVNVSGQSLYSKGDTLLVYKDGSDGYNGYYYDIPSELGQGIYTIVLQFRTREGAEAPDRTITCRSGV